MATLTTFIQNHPYISLGICTGCGFGISYGFYYIGFKAGWLAAISLNCEACAINERLNKLLQITLGKIANHNEEVQSVIIQLALEEHAKEIAQLTVQLSQL